MTFGSPPGVLRSEFCRELIRAPRQQAEVGADSGEQAATVDVVLGELDVAGQNPRRRAGLLDARNHVVDDLDDFRMVGLTEIAERGGEVAWADENAIDAIDARDLLKVIKPAFRLDLQQKTDLGVGRRVVSLDPAVARRPRLARETTETARRVANGHDRAARFLLRL